MSYAKFRNTNSTESLQEKLNKIDSKPNTVGLDETYWEYKHVGGKEFLGEAIIRFLPNPPTNDASGEMEPDPIVKFNEYSITRNGKFYKQKGRDTLGNDESDPAKEWNAPIWADSSLTKEQKIKKIAKRTETFVANVYVIKDPKKPENEGKVFRMQFGRMIYKKIKDQLFPEFESSPKVNVFDPELGANFHLRITPTKIGSQTIPTYIKSEFAPPSKLWDVDNGEFDNIWNKEYSLQSEIAPDKFRPYSELKSMFDRVVSENIMDVEKLPLSQKPKQVKEEVVDRLEEIAPWEESPKENTYSEDDLDNWFDDLDNKK